ncbi:hypothetical protein Bb109J_c0966 [Bdellovibrio bacteriovorus]|uniref:hypothetical protein n=1 Tax=Bdellovibrio bacteriovorus TaxID=959 RepID=UPI00045BF3C4|nr:hypothetical protein [Bdellovibrio bacteriovorus]AHZ86308.1 hypothetical protein EP01_15395 [Bdellovibrio bacteriovorus]BEV67546.1 hypothetical protein Bb109J_c0966 [Bdellovibrio bacteriovorus]
MKKVLLAGLMIAGLMGCSSKDKLDTELEDAQLMGRETVGKRDDNYVIQEKKNLVQHLQEVQTDVYTMEENIYGNRDLGNKGKYGVLRDCKIEASPQAGSKVDMVPKNILTEEEGQLARQTGVDESGTLITLREEDLNKRLKRFEGYKSAYEKQEEWFDNEIQACRQSQRE